jgi:hypothetical protein
MISLPAEWVQKVFDTIPKMVVTLNPDHTSPIYLREQLCECRKYMNEANQAYQTIKKYMWDTDKALSASKALYSLSLEKMIATDDDVRKGMSYKDRLALANQKLSSDISDITALEDVMSDLKAMEEIVKLKIKELGSVGSDIRTSKQLIVAELSIGGHAGLDPDLPTHAIKQDPSILLSDVPNEPSTPIEEEKEPVKNSVATDMYEFLKQL